MVSLRKTWRLLKETFSEWKFNEVSLLASSLAYYTVFSLVPLMIMVIMLVGAIFGEAAAKGQIVGQIQGVVGKDAAQVISNALTNMRADATGGQFRFILNLVFLAFGASGVFAQIQSALDKIWEVEPAPGNNLFHFLRKRFLSFAMVLVIAFLLLVSFVANTILAALVSFLNTVVSGLGYLWQTLSFLLFFGVITLLFALIYTILPDAKVKWHDAFVGATITALLFMVGQFLFGLFLRQTEFGSAYGVAGSFLVIITWIYYAAHILFLGAEFTKVYARRHGSPIEPEEYAVSRQESEAQKQQRARSSKDSSHSRQPNQRLQRDSHSFLTQIWRRGTRKEQRLRGKQHRRR